MGKERPRGRPSKNLSAHALLQACMGIWGDLTGNLCFATAATTPRPATPLLTSQPTSEHHDAALTQQTRLPPLTTNKTICLQRVLTPASPSRYIDEPSTLRAKVHLLASMVKRSKNMISYTGAGISTAAGIDCFATHNSGGGSAAGEAAGKLKDWMQAKPTASHFAMAELYRAGHLKHWIQQNHDSLPQKAGYPQSALNEIHGSLHDPSNPIVPYEGVLRDDLHAWLREWQQRADLCLALGTSLSGFNADSVPSLAADKQKQGKGLGLVIVNLQRTPYDEVCSLRIFARIDTVMRLLLQELDLTVGSAAPSSSSSSPASAPATPPTREEETEDLFRIPFSPVTGHRLGGRESTVWDLRIGAHVRLTGGPYEGDMGTVVAKSEEGHYRIRFTDSVNPALLVPRRAFSLWLGSWWIPTTCSGHLLCPGAPCPFLNVTEDEFTAHKQAQRLRVSAAIDKSKYARMLKAGVPMHVVQAKMAREGCIDSSLVPPAQPMGAAVACR